MVEPVPPGGRPSTAEEIEAYRAWVKASMDEMRKVVAPLYPEMEFNPTALDCASLQHCFQALLMYAEMAPGHVYGVLGMAMGGALAQMTIPDSLGCSAAVSNGLQIAREHMPPILTPQGTA